MFYGEGWKNIVLIGYCNDGTQRNVGNGSEWMELSIDRYRELAYLDGIGLMLVFNGWSDGETVIVHANDIVEVDSDESPIDSWDMVTWLNNRLPHGIESKERPGNGGGGGGDGFLGGMLLGGLFF